LQAKGEITFQFHKLSRNAFGIKPFINFYIAGNGVKKSVTK